MLVRALSSWLTRRAGTGGRALDQAQDHAAARLREMTEQRDYWRRIAERLLDEALATRSTIPNPGPIFTPPTSADELSPFAKPFAELFTAMAAERVYSDRDRPDSTS